MKILKTSIVLLLCLLWIFITNYKYFPINNIGELLTYKSGLLSIPIEKNRDIRISNNHQLKILIDNLGIPHIYSDTKNELAYGLGYMHAKDRFFQMELISRTVLGELSEILGEQTFSSDKVWKPYEFNRKSKELLEEFKKTDLELYKYLVSYSEGVNSYLKNNELNDPLYKIFNLEPRAWKPEYCLLITWYMSGNLAYFDYHIQQQEILNKLSEQVLKEFYPRNPKNLNTILPNIIKNNNAIKKEYKKVAINKKIHDIKFNKDIGSNNWAVNSNKTENNSSILVNDPHMFLTLPSAFYEVHLSSDVQKLYGYSIPGIPLIVSGHNDKVAWGITNGEWDLTDRYLLNVKRDSLYLYKGSWIPFQQKKYTINVRGKGNKTFFQKRTVHGKVIKEDSLYYAQKWYPSDKTYSIKALYNMMQSQNWYSFKKALEIYDYPPQNFIYSDINDTIGIVCAGKLPMRYDKYEGGILDGTKKPINSKFIDTLWYTDNPNKNYLFSANQQPIQNEYYFGAHWHKDDFRVNRISNLLEKESKWNMESMMQMQTDQVDLSFEQYKKLIDNYTLPKEYTYIKKTLVNWNGLMTAESHQALVYEIFRESVIKEAKNYANNQLKIKQTLSFKIFIKYLNQSDFTYPQNVTKQEIVKNIFKRTDSILKFQYNKQNKKYKIKSKFYINNISFLPGFGESIYGVGGNKNTINMNASTRPVFRSIYEINKNKIKGYTIMAGGQSGRINSINYSDQLMKWKKGLYTETQFEDNSKKLKNIKSTIIFE